MRDKAFLAITSLPPNVGTRRLGRARRGAALVLLALLLGAAAEAAPLAREDVPTPLEPWVEWVMAGHEEQTCPPLLGGSTRTCVWPARLELALESDRGTFRQVFHVDVASTVRLPGDARHWPEEVRVDGRAAPVVRAEGRPALALPAGRHEVTGRFVWQTLPRLLRVPPETGLVALTLEGQPVPFPRRDADGRLWLRDQAETAPAEGNRLSLQVHRLVVDDIPLQLTTDVQFQVSGQSREVTLGPVLPPDFVPLDVTSPLPARLEPDGTLRLQVRPGRWQLRIAARRSAPAAELTLPAAGADWDPSEVWAFEARPKLRLVDVEGVLAVDPSQTELPAAWHSLPAYQMNAGDTMRLAERRRGSSGPLRDELTLVRNWHLDFDGRGATVRDTITGTMRGTARLDMGAGTELGRAAVNGEDQPITRRDPDASGDDEPGAGIEVPLGQVRIEADSRVETGVRTLPAVGWAHDVSALEGQVQVPPGWRLLHASGVDRASATWIGRWTLLDLFVVTLVAMAFFRLFGAAVGLLAAAALALTYTEPGAPAFVWVFVLAFEGLRRVVPEGRFGTLLVGLRALTLGVLIVIAIPFALQQLRSGMYPALERPWAVVTDPQEVLAELDDVVLPDAEATAPVPERFASAPKAGRGTGSVLAQVVRPKRSPSGASSYGYAADPNARIPTGPGRPDWQWESVSLRWSGPVDRDQQLRLWLVPPWANTGLAFLRTALLLALVIVSLGTARDLVARWWPQGPPPAKRVASSAGAVLLAAGLAAAGAPGVARADVPPKELLDELRTRLLETPECHPQCAAVPRLALDARPERLDLRMTVEVAAETAIPLPGGLDATQSFVPTTVLVDGVPARALSRREDGGLWLRLAPGSHTVHLRGALPPRETVELPVPLRPYRAEATLEGWELQGLHADGRSEGALQLRRLRASGDGPPGEVGRDEPAERFEPTAIPPFVVVTRDVSLGLSWQTRTTVQRVAPSAGAIVIEVPLLGGESVTTPGIRVEDEVALVSLGPGQKSVSWASVLPIRDRLELAAPADVPWTEVWRIDPSPIWHVEPDGIPWVEAPAEGLTRRREWRPWPGERVVLAVERPAGVAGGTLTIDASHLVVTPGLRATDATLSLRMRSSQGGQHRVRLPEGAELLALSLNGRDQPLRQEGREIPLAIVPGAQTAELSWRSANGVALVTKTPEIDLGLPSVNHHVEMQVPQNRWTLLTTGSRLGPAVLFWPLLLLLGLLAVGLGRLSITPLRTHHWFLLGIGLSQAPVPVAGFVVVWLLALGWRRERGAALGAAWSFDLLQIGLVALTCAALVALFGSIQQGLLGTPEMQIAGNGSSAGMLRWYEDRVAALLPQASFVSVSLWFYRLAMLGWALWVASALVGWLRWGWECFSHAELWRPLREKRGEREDPPPPTTGFERSA